MKRFLLAAGIAVTSTSVFAVGTSLETDAEKFSYAFGINFTQSMMRQGAPLDADAVYMAIKDALAGSEPRLSAEAMDAALRSAAQKAGEKKKAQAGENLAKGKAYMDKNKAKKGVTTLPDGLQYEVLREGTGAQPTADSTVKVHYTGKLVDGREFDSSKREGKPVTFPVNGVIEGWSKILPLMKVGARWLVTIPPELAYGVNGSGAVIGPNETLVFEIELLDIVKE
jgi:FKBP-type peptidyl-prolyl cis-trans isomerase FklB